MEQAARRVAIAGLLFICTACSERLERQILRAYFDTCAIADETALANVALVWLHPTANGVVGRFRVVGVGPRERQPASASPVAVRLSLRDPHRSPDATRAVLVTEAVSVSAEMHRGGSTFNLMLTVTLARAETPDAVGRWIVVRLAPGGRTLPAASSDRPSETSR